MDIGCGVATAAPDATVTFQEKPRRKVAIVGTAPSSRDLAPFKDPSWEIWVIKLFNAVPRWDRWYEIHDYTAGKARWPKEYLSFLATKHGKPVFTQGTVPEIPDSVPFPKDELLAKFPRYFTNSISWMIAHALHEGVNEIGLWGVDMAQASEYAHQRPCVEYFLGLAQGLGVSIHVPQQSDIMKSHKLYAFDGDHSLMAKTRAWRSEMQANQAKASQAEQEAHDRAVFLQGALDALGRVEQWV